MSIAKSFLKAAVKAASGKQRFWIAAGWPMLVEIEINPSADNIALIREKAQHYVSLKPKGMPGEWPRMIGTGISPLIADGIAYALACKVSVYADGTTWDTSKNKDADPVGEKEQLSDIDLLELARGAGGVFDVLTREIKSRVNGLNMDVEREAIEAMGEASTATNTA